MKLALALIVLMASGAHAAQMGCFPAITVIPEITGSKWSETLSVVGSIKTPQGPVPFMTFVNGKTGTWTMISRPTPDMACVIALGDGYEASYPDDPGEEM